jgi:hypothetical protein
MSDRTALDRLGKTVAIISLVVGPLTLIVADVMQWTLQPGGADPTAVDVAAQFPAAWLIVALLSVFGPVIWLMGLPAASALPGGRGRLTTRIGVLGTALGLAAGVGHLAAFFSLYGSLASADLDAVASDRMMAAGDADAVGSVLLIVFLVCYSLGPIIMTVGLRIARRVAVWVPIAAVLTASANLFGGPIAGIVQLVTLAGVWGAVVVAILHSERDPGPRAAWSDRSRAAMRPALKA